MLRATYTILECGPTCGSLQRMASSRPWSVGHLAGPQADWEIADLRDPGVSVEETMSGGTWITWIPSSWNLSTATARWCWSTWRCGWSQMNAGLCQWSQLGFSWSPPEDPKDYLEDEEEAKICPSFFNWRRSSSSSGRRAWSTLPSTRVKQAEANWHHHQLAGDVPAGRT